MQAVRNAIRRPMRSLAAAAIAASAVGVIPAVMSAPAYAAPTPTPTLAECNQPTHVWIATKAGSLANGNTEPVNSDGNVWVTGMQQPQTPITFKFDAGSHEVTYVTNNANGNCVVNQEKVSISNMFPGFRGSITVHATVIPWENLFTQQTIFVGTLTEGS